jgi:primosomal protein N' (replication factor Y) (superfamily II helicase)
MIGSMYVHVNLINKFDKVLLYRVPEHIARLVLIGSIVRVPLKNNVFPALVINLLPQKPSSAKFKIRSVESVEKMPHDKYYHLFIKKLADYCFVEPIHLYHRLHSFFMAEVGVKKLTESSFLQTISTEEQQGFSLTQEQSRAVCHIKKFIYNPAYSVTLLHGVTSSGKTEVYKKLIFECIKIKKSVLLLLPEVSLCLQFQSIFKKQLSEVEQFGFHSASRTKEKRNLWKALVSGRSVLVMGVHLPVFLPIANLGLIIVDEEHETGFQEKKHPKINSKESVLLRAQTCDIPVLLGSATPSITSLVNVKRSNWMFLSLKNRFSGTFPTIQRVCLVEKKRRKRRVFWVSQELEKAISDRLKKKEQVIVYINRRGDSFFAQCKSCGFIFQCVHCSVSLTPHAGGGEENDMEIILRCHYCDYYVHLPLVCPECNASAKGFLRKGIGTQQAVRILKNLFPDACVGRADLDSTTKKCSWKKTVEEFEKGNLDILVGTKTITKGYHFPKVTLVGILWADLSLNFPRYNAVETTLQELIQVAGRAGRCSKESLVVVQYIQEHQIFDFIDEQKYLKFFQNEVILRKETRYPPFCRLVCVELRHKMATIVEEDAQVLASWLNIKASSFSLTILGPTIPAIARIKDIEMRHIFIKSDSFMHVSSVVKSVDMKKFQSRIFIISSQ